MFSSKIFQGARRAAASVPRRSFAGDHHHAPKKYEGAEAVVRKYLPEDWQIVLVTATIEFGLIGALLMKPSKKAPAAPAVAPSSGATTVPSVADESFDAWSQIPGNMEKYEQSIIEWANKA